MKKILVLTLILIGIICFTACDSGNISTDVGVNSTPSKKLLEEGVLEIIFLHQL